MPVWVNNWKLNGQKIDVQKNETWIPETHRNYMNLEFVCQAVSHEHRGGGRDKRFF